MSSFDDLIESKIRLSTLSNNLASNIAQEAWEAKHPAKLVCEMLVEEIRSFEAKLPNDMQAGGNLVGFHETVFAINAIGYWNPSVIKFYGTLPSGEHVQLLQHISQLNLLLVAVKRLDDISKPRRAIGFEVPEKK